ncbi:hypothetical protein NE237_032331 [Protea cynaroides]|uniref:GAG-pre-integrase domain-containing protein n=1 Tax=Protea cynaroides TaxID=273540 RepID=A0A9Q0R3A6_9MAGN|nr:hypothetical protein NE237_032331 [Protea cynaroides]
MVGEVIVTNAVTESTTIWHRRLGHMSMQGLKVLLDRGLLLGLKSVNLDFYEDCLSEKHHRAPFCRSVAKSQNILHLMHSDIWETPVESVGGSSPVEVTRRLFCASVVMEEKFYALAYDRGGIVFNPCDLSWRNAPRELSLRWRGRAVLDGIFYCYDGFRKIKGFNLKEGKWK